MSDESRKLLRATATQEESIDDIFRLPSQPNELARFFEMSLI
jgi:hypothetical protein